MVAPDYEVVSSQPSKPIEVPQLRKFTDDHTNDLILVVEDNFVIATDRSDTLELLGLRQVEIASTHEDAMVILDEDDVAIAILDVNLGEGRGTSQAIAERLAKTAAPFAFATGYGERVEMPPIVGERLVMTKPVETERLRAVVSDLLAQRRLRAG